MKKWSTKEHVSYLVLELNQSSPCRVERVLRLGLVLVALEVRGGVDLGSAGSGGDGDGLLDRGSGAANERGAGCGTGDALANLVARLFGVGCGGVGCV